MHLHRLIDDRADLFWNHRFHCTDIDPGFLIAEHIHRLRCLQDRQSHRIDLNPRARDHFEILTQFGDFLPERGSRSGALDHHFQGDLGLANRAHTMVDTAWAEAHL